jgi:hypothetical protein
MTTDRGNFIGNLNRTKQPGDKRPLFQGRIGLPGSDKEYVFALWGYEGKNGKTVFNGRANAFASNSDAIAQVGELIRADGPATGVALEDNGLTVKPQQLVLFANGFKDEAHPNRPDFYGRWNPGDGQPLVAISAWMHKDRYERPLLAGQTSFPRKDVDPAKVEATPQTLDGLVQAGLVTTADQAKPKRPAKSR